MRKKFLSIILTIVMIAGVIPFGAITSFATDSGTFAEFQQLIYNAENGGTIKLTKDYVWGKDDDDPLMIQNEDSTGKTLTIDMNGHKISGDSDYSCIAVDRWIEEGTTSKLTLIDNSASGGGTICSGGSGVYINERGTLIAKNIKFTGNETGVYNSEGCMIIENCEFTGNEYGISNYWTMAVTDTTVTGNEYGIANNGDDLYIGGSTKVTDNEEANIYLEKDAYKYTGESAWDDEFCDLAPFTLGDGTTQIEALGNYVVKAPSNDFKAGITTWECESSTPMYYDEINMEWYPDWEKTETVKDEACAGAFTTNGTADDVKYFFADDPTKYVKFDTDKLVLDTIPSGSYKITVNSGDHGVVYADKQFATSGEEITLNVVPDNGYQLKKLTVLSAISMAPPITPVQDASDKTKYTFKMPGYPVRGTSEFEEAETGGTTATFNPKDHWTEYCSPLGSKTFGSSNEVTATFSNGFQYDGWGKIAIGDPDYITASVTISVPAGSVISKVAFNYLSTQREVGVFTSTVGSMSETVTEPFGSNEWTGSANSVTFTPTGAMTIASFDVTYTSSQGTSHTHKASENYMANASAHWFACSGDDCSLKGKTDAETLANYEAAFADKDTGEALKTTLGYTAHSGMGDFKCDVCNYEDVAGAIESIKTELGVAKSRALCDEARAAFDTAIENVEKATNLENVDKALREGTDSANEADKKFEKAVKDAKDALDAQNKNDPLLDDSSVTTGKENIDKATSLIAVENAKNTAVENIKKAQAEELAKAKETAKNALDDENAKDELIDNSSVTTGKQNVDNALTKAAVSSAKDTAIGNIQSAQALQLGDAKAEAIETLNEILNSDVSDNVKAAAQRAIDKINGAKTSDEVKTIVSESADEIQSIIDEESKPTSLLDRIKSLLQRIIDWFKKIIDILKKFLGIK